MEGCRGTKAGNEFLQGLSGGQKRRLSLAVALIKEPKVIFLDEPTSGLDAAAAASIMMFLKQLAADKQIIVVCTIHQPSTKVFDGFDKVMLLSNGREVFCGPAADTPTYFKSIGKPFPLACNPAEYMLDIVNREFSDPTEVDRIIGEWKSGDLAVASQKVVSKGPIYRVNFATQTMVLLKKHLKLTMRDPTVYLGRLIMFIMATCFFVRPEPPAKDRPP